MEAVRNNVKSVQSRSVEVSVIIPMYNVEAYIGDTIRSLKSQTFESFEAVLVDDGSSDRTVQTAFDEIDDDGRFWVVRAGNAGPATARNRGLERARGTYIMFLDSDDMLAKNALEALYSKAKAQNLDYLDFSACTFYEDEGLRSVRDESFYEHRKDIPGVMPGCELFVRFQRQREYVCSLCLHFFKRSLLERCGLRLLDGMYVHEDELFSPLLIAQAERAAFLNEPLYRRRVRAGSSMTSGRGMRNVKSMFRATQGLKRWLSEHGHEYDVDFVAAMAQRIFELYGLAAEDALSVPADELVAFSASLYGSDRVDFEVSVMQTMLAREELLQSYTYRIGDAVLTAPRAARDLMRKLAGE